MASNPITIGVLCLQGAFIEHIHLLQTMNIDTFEIRQKKDLQIPMDGLIIPGGESTAMFRLLNHLDMKDTLTKMIQEGLPVFGTCAGLLLLARDIDNYQESFLKVMNIKAKKNAYGRQLSSFRAQGTFASKENIELVFIRAPYIVTASDDVDILATHENKIVAARQHHMLVTAFHPELSGQTTIHDYFIDMIKASNRTQKPS